MLEFRKIPSIWRNFWKWHWFFSLGKWHWFLAISKFSQGKKVNAKSVNFTEKSSCTIKFFPVVYLVNHVEIGNAKCFRIKDFVFLCRLLLLLFETCTHRVKPFWLLKYHACIWFTQLLHLVFGKWTQHY